MLLSTGRPLAGAFSAALAVLTLAAPPAAQSPGALAEFDCDSVPGALVPDLSGSGHDGSCGGAAACPVLVPEGVHGGAYDFTGDGNYVELTGESDFDFGGPFTVSLWMRTSDFGNTWAQLVGKGDSAWALERLQGSSLVAFTTFSPAAHKVVTQTALDDGQWHHLAAVYDGTSKRLYVDGVLEDSAPYTETIGRNDEPVRLGFNSEYPSGQYDGLLDDVRIHGRALPQDEIVALMGVRAGAPQGRIDFLTPSAGAQLVGAAVDVSYRFSGFAYGADHAHFQLDGGPTIEITVPVGQLTLTSVPVGDHTLTSVIVRADHSPIPGSQSSVSFSTEPEPPLEASLLAAFSLDVDGGGVVPDLSGGGNEGSCTTAVTCPVALPSGGVHRGAYDFTGDGNFVTLANESVFDLRSFLSASFWMRSDSAGNAWGQVVGKGDSAWSVERYDTSDRLAFTTFRGGQSHSLVSARDLFDGQWHHVAVVYDGGAKRIYVDGLQDVAVAYTGPIDTNDFPVRLGANAEFAPGQYDGRIDEVRLYVGALTPDEVLRDRDTAVVPPATVAITAPADGAEIVGGRRGRRVPGGRYAVAGGTTSASSWTAAHRSWRRTWTAPCGSTRWLPATTSWRPSSPRPTAPTSGRTGPRSSSPRRCRRHRPA